MPPFSQPKRALSSPPPLRAHLGPRPRFAVRPAPARRAQGAPCHLVDPDDGQARLPRSPGDRALARAARCPLRAPRRPSGRDAPPRLPPREPAEPSPCHGRSAADEARRLRGSTARAALEACVRLPGLIPRRPPQRIDDASGPATTPRSWSAPISRSLRPRRPASTSSVWSPSSGAAVGARRSASEKASGEPGMR
jgi:hypothetical protein